MSTLKRSDLERVMDRVQKDELSANEANVEMVRMQRVRVISGKVPRQVRSALNSAVKSGVLAHMKKEGAKPEVYYHPDFKWMANEERKRAELAVARAFGKIFACGLPIGDE